MAQWQRGQAMTIRVALSLGDIEKSVNRVADSLEKLAANGVGLGPVEGRPSVAGDAGIAPSEAEIAAAIAAAARFPAAKRSGGREGL